MKTSWIRGGCWLVLWIALHGCWLPTLNAADEPADVFTPIAGQPARLWQDDSGYHRVRGTLVGIGPDAVRLLKENQRVTTVPLIRLSDSDRQHVEEIHVVLKPNLNPGDRPEVASDAPSQLTAQAHAAPQHVVGTITLSREFLERFVRDVDRTQPLTTTILGVPIHGWSHTEASANLELVPDQNKAVFEIPIRGQVTSRTVGTASVARIHSNSVTDFEKRMRVSLSGSGVTVEPKQLSTVNRFITTSVSTTARVLSGLITRIASRRVQASKPAADQIARQQERQRINSAFESAAKTSVVRLNQMLRDFLHANGESALIRDSKLGFSTTQAALRVAVVTVDPPQELPQPPPVDPDYPLVAQLHASLFVQASQAGAASGMTSRLQELAAGESAAMQAIRKEIQNGTFASSWSEDESWLTITWQPSAEVVEVEPAVGLAEVR